MPGLPRLPRLPRNVVRAGFLVGAVAAPVLLSAVDAPLPNPKELPVQAGLPDPLVMLDGRKVASREMWFNERRPELVRLFQHYMYGMLPPKPDAISSDVERVDATAFDGKATLSEVTIRFGPAEVPPIHLMLVVPNRRTTPAPVVLGMNYFGNHTLVRDKRVRLPDNWMPERGAGVVANRATEASRGSWADIWRIEDVIDRGYALATFYNGDIDPDTPDQRGLQRFFPASDPADECGTIGAWAWGLQRAVDYLVTAPGIDPSRIVVTGHSRLGKAALLAAAFDERIALAIPHQAGCGGSAPSRARIAIGKSYDSLDTAQTRPPETVADINKAFPHWFNARFKEFNGEPERLPIDQNCLVALCAPRPVLFTNGRADTWINPAGQFEVMRAAAPVYRLLGAGDFTAEQLPADGKLIDGALGYYLRPEGHSLLREDWKVFLDFADKRWETTDRRDSRVADGPIMIDPDHPHSFRYQNGKPFFPMGDTAYFLIAQPTNVIAHYFDARRAHRFNFVRMMAMAEGFWPFGGTPARPDYTKIDEGSLQKLDWVFDCAADRGMNIELILWGYGIEGGEGLWADPARQNFWVDTLVNRYRSRPNLFMYTIANEFERYADGDYQYNPADVEWARRMAARIHVLDPARPVGCHPSVWITDQDVPGRGPRPFASYNGFTQRRPQVVWPLWDGSEVNLNVTQNNEGVQPRTWGDIEGQQRGLTYYSINWQGTEYPVKWTTTGWEFEAAGLEDCIAEDWAHGKPVLDSEFGYQFEPGYDSAYPFTTHQLHQPATVRKKIWKIATAGGYFAAGFAGTAVAQEFTMRDVDNFQPASTEVLYDFFTKETEFWKLAPHLELVASYNVLLALPGTEYVAYFPRGGTNYLTVVEGNYRSTWLHPETGRYFGQPDFITTDGSRDFVPPERPDDDWVLHLRRRD